MNELNPPTNDEILGWLTVELFSGRRPIIPDKVFDDLIGKLEKRGFTRDKLIANTIKASDFIKNNPQPNGNPNPASPAEDPKN